MSSAPSEPEGRRAPLLLHSLAELGEIIFGCLEAADARFVVEVGSEEGRFTADLARWVEGRDEGRLASVDPHPSPGLRRLCEASPAVELIEARSLEVLDSLDPADAYLIDGDHNFYTVLHELEAIDRKAKERDAYPLVVLHDLGWPCARRDMYYDPEGLPEQAVHPYSYDKGRVPGTSEAVEGGFRGEGEFAVALDEGGPTNGVLTAVEDFIEGRDDLVLAFVPSVFGLGILYSQQADFAAEVKTLLEPYDRNPMLERLEANRLQLYVRLLEIQDEAIAAHRSLREVSGALEATLLRVRDVEVENRALWARVTELEGRMGALEGQRQVLRQELQSVVNSRALALAERLAGLRRLTGAKASLSRRRLQQVLDELDD